jgi:hypothetical protein
MPLLQGTADQADHSQRRFQLALRDLMWAAIDGGRTCFARRA